MMGTEAKKMQWFDTHAHVNDDQFAGEAMDVIRRAHEAGVARIQNIFDGTKGVDAAAAFLDETGLNYAAIGVHPHDAEKGVDEGMLAAFDDPRFRALGEIGLDYHYDFSPRDAQRDVFARELDMAYAVRKPVVLHIREAHGDALNILRTFHTAGKLTGGVVHCYSGSRESAREYLDMGFHISFTGSVTFKNARGLLEAAKYVPDERIMVETDCPYMSPVPLRGQRNEPANAAVTGRFLAELRGTDAEEFADMTFRNAVALFGGPLEP